MEKQPNRRKRSKTLTVRLTEAEKKRIERNAARAKLTVTDYLVALSTRTEITVPPDMTPLLAELKRIGNNLNQIAVKVNAGAFHSYNFQDVLDGQRVLYGRLLALAEKNEWRP